MSILIIVFMTFGIIVSLMVASPSPSLRVTKTDKFFVILGVITIFSIFGIIIFKEYQIHKAKEYLKKTYNVKKILKHNNKYIVMLSSGQYKKFDIDVKYTIKEDYDGQKNWFRGIIDF